VEGAGLTVENLRPSKATPPLGEALYRTGVSQKPLWEHVGRRFAVCYALVVLSLMLFGMGWTIVRGLRYGECKRWALALPGAQNFELDAWANRCRAQVTGGAWIEKGAQP
jgi:hypothetical protein